MAETYVLYNPIAGGNRGFENAKKLEAVFPQKNLLYRDMTGISDYGEFFGSIRADDVVILCGGDGTLNRFINATDSMEIENPILYYATGNGNDFLRDLGQTADGPIPINDYIKNLPFVTVNGKKHRFLNGVGYGIDGYCCEIGDKKRTQSDKPVNYTSIAVRGLLYGYKPSAAVVTVDGQTRTYQKVWIAPTMYGRYYGGGMMPAPEQRRGNAGRTVSVAVIHDSGKLRTLCVFPSIFQGKHVTHTAIVDVLSGHRITVEFDRPSPLQIDGETVLNVKKYDVESAPIPAYAFG